MFTEAFTRGIAYSPIGFSTSRSASPFPSKHPERKIPKMINEEKEASLLWKFLIMIQLIHTFRTTNSLNLLQNKNLYLSYAVN